MNLKTNTVQGGIMLEVEPVDYCGLSDYCGVSSFYKGLVLLLRNFTAEEMTTGNMWSADIVTAVMTVFEVLEDVNSYQTSYLVRRIKQLEAAQGLVHSDDIDC